MIRQAILYLASPDDARAALQKVAGRPVAFRAVMAAVRAGVTRVRVPARFRGTALEKAIVHTSSACAAVVWVSPDAEPPAEATLLLPAAALVPVPAVARLLEGTVPAVLAESRAGGAPLVAASVPLVRSLWGRLAAGQPVAGALAQALREADVEEQRAGGWHLCVTSREAARVAERRLYEGLGSPLDTWLDTTLHRRLSRPVTRVAVAIGLPPNAITATSLLLGTAAAWCFWRGEVASAVAGLFLYALAVVLDHSDGEVARLTLAESVVGDWFDFVVDTVIHALIVSALGLAAQRLAGGGAAVLGGVAAVGVLASAAFARASQPAASVNGVGAVLHGLSNRNGFYAMLAAFTLALAVLPPALPFLMLAVAVGMHAFWLGHLAYRVARRRVEPTAGRRVAG